MIAGLLGLIVTVSGVAVLGNSLINIISSGSWKSWGISDWLYQILMAVACLFPFFKVFSAVSKGGFWLGGWIMNKLLAIPVLGKIFGTLYGLWVMLREGFYLLLHPFFVQGGWLYRVGQAVESIGGFFGKHPAITFGLLFASQMFDGIFRQIFQTYGDMSMRAASFMYENMSNIMNDKQYANPISDAIAILDGSKSSLPPCFVAVWGAVGASQCIGLIIATFHYLFLYAALWKGYKVMGK